MKKALPYLFLISWLLSACSVDTMLDDWRSCVVAAVAMITAIVCVVILNWREE